MKILILGGTGMLGSQLIKSLSPDFEVAATLSKSRNDYINFNVNDTVNLYENIDVRNTDDVLQTLIDHRPDYVINAVGIIKQSQQLLTPTHAIELNALFPHKLSRLCQAINAKLIHFSTDCVFDGKDGYYTEKQLPNSLDLYGQTKHLGEVIADNTLVLRSSIIGLELRNKKSLIEWFLQQQGTIKGYTQAIYSGFTTMEMARIISKIMLFHPNLHGIWHVASNPISKYELLRLLTQYLDRHDIVIEPDDAFTCDRSLCGDQFSNHTNYTAPSWEAMLSELAEQIKMRDK